MNNNFIEAKLETKFGRFNFRVYNQSVGRETIVLYTESLGNSASPLVRIHSECITGDTFSSLFCDCGEQLSSALELIQKKNGVLIYLRQEGRGIGLYEKIKAYQLQAKGYDTFDANIALGHKADGRTYEMAKVVLDDLGISKVVLLTNNPSKISELSKLGINVVEREPVIIPSNEHNKKYYLTKSKKFKYFLNTENSYYYYQFQIDAVENIDEISKFLAHKIKDPLLKIAAGVSANPLTLTNKVELTRIESIFSHSVRAGFVPILHFSFKDSLDLLKNITDIKTKMPFVQNIQLNDLSNLSTEVLRRFCLEFTCYLPLSDDNFDLIHEEEFRKIIEEYKIYILLDNSKGRGIQEPISSLKKKIDLLLSYGLNDIILCGGFGPDELESYFTLKRHYKINFSIDAETKLKTNKRIDIEKIKTYLFQLIRSDEPNFSALEQTRTFMKRFKKNNWETININNKEFSIHPNVFNPGHFPSTQWFIDVLHNQVEDQKDFCEIGCGSGVISCLMALKNKNLQIMSTDISSFATETTEHNIKKLKLKERIRVITSDVLDKVPSPYKFDTIFWALPFGFLDPGTKISLEEMQVFDPGYKSIRKLFKTGKHFLKPKGQLLLGFSKDLGHKDLLFQLASDENLHLTEIAHTELTETRTVSFELIKGIYKF